MVCRVTVGLVFDPLLHLGVVGLAGPLPLVGGIRGTPSLKSRESNITGDDEEFLCTHHNKKILILLIISLEKICGLKNVRIIPKICPGS